MSSELPDAELDAATFRLAPAAEPAGEGERCSVTITVVDGPDRGAAALFDLRAFPPGVLVGQSPVCEVRLSDRQVSRRHARLELSGREVRLTDLGSTNGTWVSGLRVSDVFLRGGESMRVGETTLRIDRTAASSPMPSRRMLAFGRLVGSSRAMQSLYALCERLAESTVPVIIEGETGTGKELLAEAIHEASPRAQGPFVVFDCTSVPATMMEAELFGHERGAFTGAVGTRKGLFEQAHGGTLLIDEIGDLEPALQPKLLRLLERAEVRRIGGSQTWSVDVRLLAATRRDLDREVQEGRFRDDLFHRLAVGRIELPPLRKRQGDVEVLARHFWAAMGGDPTRLEAVFLQRLEAHSWPGNVRELRNAVARRLALGDLAGPTVSSRPSQRSADFMTDVLEQDLPFVPARQRVVDEFERRYVERALERHGGNVSRAAAAAGIARRTLQIVRRRTGPR
ncbi:MAG: sigma 54-interacting transcriptional regulator [Polyangiaceae bacterium]